MITEGSANISLLRTKGNYVIAFIAYGISALLAFHQSAKTPPMVTHANVFNCIVQVVVSFGVTIFFFSLTPKTTYAVEKGVLALSGAYFILYLLTVLQTFGYLPAVLSSNRPLFVIITCSSAVLVGIRVVQVLAKGPHQAGFE